jgi:hypothetical protein
MPEFTVYGEVIRAIGPDLGIRVENADELREFWTANDIDTQLTWFDNGEPVVSIGRKQDIALCSVGDRVSLTFTTVDRANGKRGVQTTGFECPSHKSG